MLVREIMTSPVVSVRPDSTLKEAVVRLDEHQVTSMPVVDEHDHIVGVVSEADVLRDFVLPDRRPHETSVRVAGPMVASRVCDVMTHLPLFVAPDDDVALAVELLVSTQVKSLPVVDHDRVVGMVSRRDVIAVLAHNDDLIEAEVDDLLRSVDLVCEVEVVDGIVHVGGPEDRQSRELVRTLAGTVPGVVGVGFDE